MNKTSRAFALRVGVLLGVSLFGCAQVWDIDGCTDKGAGGQGGEQSSSSTMAGQGPVGSASAGAGGQTTASSASAGSMASSTGLGNCKPDGVSCQQSADCCSQVCEGGVCKCL